VKRLGPWVALLVVWVFWGGTYIAIRVADETMPPLLMAGVRYLTAGTLLLLFALRSPRGDGPAGRRSARPGRAPTRTQLRPARVPAADRLRPVHWLVAALIGGLMLGGGNGGVTAAERTVPAGLASLLVATVPLWLIVLDFAVNRVRIRLPAIAGLLCGLAGVGFLARPAGGSWHGIVIILAASLSWALGTILSRKLPAPDRPLVAAAMQMLTGGALLFIVAASSGELTGFHLGHVSAGSALALVYLIGPGSILALSAYVISVRELPTAIVGTYAYVNPVIAVALSATLLGEKITAGTLIGGCLIIVGVAAVVRYRAAASHLPCNHAVQRLQARTLLWPVGVQRQNPARQQRPRIDAAGRLASAGQRRRPQALGRAVARLHRVRRAPRPPRGDSQPVRVMPP
jgi:drug/metabolite transporter (DMT)-like permease